MNNLRLRRLRKNDAMRRLVRETQLSCNDFIYPLFIKEGLTQKVEIDSMPGVYQLPLSALKDEVTAIESLGIAAVILFGIPKDKDETGSFSLQDDGIIQKAIKEIKAHSKNLLVISDVCFCEYTSHGHCGIIKNGDVANDETLPLLAAQALSHAKAGADIVAPSGMMDNMVFAIRKHLDDNEYNHIPILSYAVKYASNFYGPFRQAAEGAPSFGDRKTYQMDVANSQEALREAHLDVAQGADMLMVKPAMAYLDVICQVKSHHKAIPLCAYQVSGEYTMIKFSAQKGLFDEKEMMLESLIAIKRAGADMIISYFAKEICSYLQQE